MEDFDQPQFNEFSVQPDTFPILAADGVGGIQLCPTLILGSPQALSGGVKHVYSRLAAAATEVDQGVPDLILSFISNGNRISPKFAHRFEQALSSIVSSCGLWLISSGEHDDPLAQSASNVIRRVLPQADSDLEVLHLLINVQEDVAVQSGTVMTDTSMNTMLLLFREVERGDKFKLRGQTAVRLAQPPPAFLIGVPSDHNNSGMTPVAQSPPILLSPSNDKKPLSVVIFAGASADSLDEVFAHIEHGTPVIVLQDSCELCAILYSASRLYRAATFEHSRFVTWLSQQIHSISLDQPDKAVDSIVKIFSIALDDPQLLDFLESDELNQLPAHIVDMCVQCFSASMEARQVILLAGRLNQPGPVAPLLSDVLDDELLTALLCECVAHDDRLEFLTMVLENRQNLVVTSEMLLKMTKAFDSHFYMTIVLGQCMGYSTVPDEIDEIFAQDICVVLERLSFGVQDLFPPSYFQCDLFHKDLGATTRILAIWSLLLHKPALVRCFCAYSDEPVAFTLILARIARSLSHQAKDWYFYSESLSKLADQLSQSAVEILDDVHKKSPQKAYAMVCQPIEVFNGVTLTQLAFQTNSRPVLAHEVCQRWVHRLLYGNLQVRRSPFFLAAWMKILIAGIFMFPIRIWMSIRPGYSTRRNKGSSPTAALLDVSHHPRRTRAVSTYSVVSGRSDVLTNLTSPLSVNIPAAQQMTSGADSATPQSYVFPLNIEDADGEVFQPLPKTKIRRWSPPSITRFYGTPIVKYWLSFVFRLIHIAFIFYAVVIPGCGSMWLDAGVWAWTFMWWLESLWVLHLRSNTTDLSIMPWRIFDIVITLLFLVLLLVFKICGEGAVAEVFRLNSVYPSRVLYATFLLFWCYSAVFFYTPLSDIFGPLLVRVKLMILKDFTNFLIMSSLIMLSSAAAIQAVVYPDQELTPSLVKSLLSWAWLSLFTTDLSTLKESESCRKSFVGAPTRYCSATSQYANPTCPAQSMPAYFMLLEYFVLLKLILWPILFAFFAKTAKAVDEEADKIWKFQLYTLVTDFSVRPPLPPPLTPLCFLYMLCCRVKGRLFAPSLTKVDHPDHPHKERSTYRFGAVYRNPSVPVRRGDHTSSFWRQLAIEHWKSDSQRNGSTNGGDRLRSIHEQIRMTSLANSYASASDDLRKQEHNVPYTTSGLEKLYVPSSDVHWETLCPKYNPPFYCKPVQEFPIEVQRFVETATEGNVCELRRAWRARQLQEPNRAWRLSAAGFPLNPNGRQGIAGRGVHPRFGANRRCSYIILSGRTKKEAQVLVTDVHLLPREPHPEQSTRDEKLASLLRLAGLNDGEAQFLSHRRYDTTTKYDAPSETGPALLCSSVLAEPEDTDNAWTEHEVWTVALRDRKVALSMVGYRWQPAGFSSQNAQQAQLIDRALDLFGIR